MVRADDGSVLLARRRPGTEGEGLWELPGGKIEPGETPAEAAARELAEEVGIGVDELAPWRVYGHDFVTKRVRLHWFHVTRWSGQPSGREGQPVAWVDPAGPRFGPLLPSNERAMQALGLPEVIAVAEIGRHGLDVDDLLTRVAVQAGRGLRMLLVCAPGLGPGQRVQLARRLNEVCRGTQVRLLLSGSALEASRAGAEGVHSDTRSLDGATHRPPATLWAASVRDADQLTRAHRLGAELALATPVLPTPERPHAGVLGWEGLARLAGAAPLPVYAAGGLRPTDLVTARASGAAGVVVDLGTL